MTHLSGRRIGSLFVGVLAGVGVTVVGRNDDPAVSPSTTTDATVIETASSDAVLAVTDATTATSATTTTTTTLPPQVAASTLDGPVST